MCFLLFNYKLSLWFDFLHLRNILKSTSWYVTGDREQVGVGLQSDGGQVGRPKWKLSGVVDVEIIIIK